MRRGDGALNLKHRGEGSAQKSALEILEKEKKKKRETRRNIFPQRRRSFGYIEVEGLCKAENICNERKMCTI